VNNPFKLLTAIFSLSSMRSYAKITELKNAWGVSMMRYVLFVVVVVVADKQASAGQEDDGDYGDAED
jgi:hypothetical protein